MQAFDELHLLKRGGRTLYAGPTGTESAELISYFEAIPGVPRIQPGMNPATWMLGEPPPQHSAERIQSQCDGASTKQPVPETPWFNHQGQVQAVPWCMLESLRLLLHIITKHHQYIPAQC